MDTHKLSAIFEKYAGRAVETYTNPAPASRGAVERLDPQDQTVAALRAELEAEGVSLRLWMPNGIGTMDFKPNRMNVHVGPDNQGVYRLARTFRMG